MKATLEFNLPEEQEAFDGACNADVWEAATRAALEKIRSRLKYGEPTEEERKALEDVREEILAMVGRLLD